MFRLLKVIIRLAVEHFKRATQIAVLKRRYHWLHDLYKVLVGKLGGKRPLGRSRRRWDVGVWTGSTWLRIGTGDGQL